MEPIEEVNGNGMNIPALLHSIVINTTQLRDCLSLEATHRYIHKRTHFTPARTGMYMVRAAYPDYSGTLSFEQDIEDVLTTLTVRSDDAQCGDGESFLHSVSIYVTFSMDGLLLPYYHPAVVLATNLTPNCLLLYTASGRRTPLQQESRRLRRAIKQVCSQFVRCDSVTIRNSTEYFVPDTIQVQLEIVSRVNNGVRVTAADIDEMMHASANFQPVNLPNNNDGVMTQSEVLAIVAENSVQNMYSTDFEPQSGESTNEEGIVQIENVEDIVFDIDDSIPVSYNVVRDTMGFVPTSTFSDIMPSTLPINNFDLMMLAFDQVINNYAESIQPDVIVDNDGRTINFQISFDFIRSVDVAPMLANRNTPSNVLGESDDANKQQEPDGINLQSGNWTESIYNVFNYKREKKERDFVDQYTIFKVFGWIMFSMVGYLYYATIYKITTFIRTQHFLYKMSSQYAYYKKAAALTAEEIFTMCTTLTPDSRLRLVEIKSLITALYYIYNGQVGVASSHLQTLLLTRPISLKTVLINGGVLACHYMMSTKYCVFTCEGKKCVVDNQEFVRLCQISDTGRKITLDDINESMEVQAGEIEEIASNIGSLFAQWKMDGMQVKDIELANKQFAYMRNVSHVSSDRVGLMIILLRLILRTIWSYDPLDIDFQLFASDIVDCGVAIKNMSNNKNQICSDRKIMLDVIALHKKATEYSTHARMQSMPGCLQRFFMMRYKEIDEMCTIAHQYLLGSQQRAEPVCVFIRGDPGSGKSLLTLFLMNALSELDGEEFTAEKCYTLSKDKFFEGYFNQKFCNSDDVFQVHCTETYQTEAERIIRMNNSTPYNLPMAFDGKGTTFFNSQYVFLSSNYGKGLKWANCSFTELQIADVGAIKRRLNLVLERSARSNANVCDNEYFVAQCDSFPDYVGQKLKPGEIAHLVYKMRAVRLERFAKTKYTRNELRAQIGLPPVEDKEVDFYPVTETKGIAESTSDFFSDLGKQIRETYMTYAHSKPVDQEAKIRNNMDFEVLMSDEKRFLDFIPDDDLRTKYLKAQLDYRQLVHTNMMQNDPGVMPGLIPSNNGLIGDDVDIIVQNGEIPQMRKPPTAVEWLLKILPIQLCEWMDSPYCKWFIYGFTVIVAAIVCQKIFKTIFPMDFEAQSWKNKEIKGWGQKKNSRARKLNIHPSENFGFSTIPQVSLQSSAEKTFVPQSSMLDFYACMTKTMSKGVALVEMYGEDDDRSFKEYGIAFHIRDGIMITPSHLMLKYTMEDIRAYMIVHLDGKVYKMRIPEKTWKIENEDVMMFELPKGVPRPVSLYKYLLRAESSPNIHPLQEVYQIGIGFNNEVVVRNYNRVPKSGSINHVVDGEIIVYDLGFTYSGDCQKGHSGSPSIVFTLEGPKVVGMHVGATKRENIGITYVLCQEWFDQLTVSMETQSGSMLPVVIDRTVPASEANNLPRRTRIRKSPIYSWNGPPNNIPAKFVPFENDKGEIVDPLVVAMSKLKQEHFQSPEDLHEDKVLEYMKVVYPPRDDARLFTYDEAINGLPERKIPSIVGSTSAGYPYCLNALKGKNPYIVQINNRYTYQEEFLKKVQVMEEKLRDGEQISVIWADTLKDETRPREKVMAGKTRLFTSCPLHYLILVRRYFLDFVGRVQDLAATHPVSVGINPHSLQWTLLYQRMAELNGSIIAGDFSNYDGSVPAFIGKIVLKFINQWYKADNVDANVRALLFEHLWNGVRICGDKIYFTKDGNPSGNPLTSIFNSLINMIMCYIILTQDFKLLEDEFRMAMYGDDNIISISHPGFRVSDFTPHFKRRFNMSYTHFTKVEGNDPFDTMDTIRYLGRAFVKNMTVMRAPLQLETILESTYWVRGTDHDNVAFISTIRSACLELSHYSLHEYNKYVDQLFDAVRIAGLLPHHSYLVSYRRSWFDYHAAFYDENYKTSSTMLAIRREVLENALIDTTTSLETQSLEEMIEIVCQSGNNTTPKFHGEVSESRHVEFTERAPNEAPQSQQLQLGDIRDVAPVGQGIVGPEEFQDPMKTCNMELFQLDRALDREYLLGNITWSLSSASGATLATYYFPQDLFSQTFIAQKIADFRFFRAGVRLSVRLTSNKLLYGSILVVYIPQLDTNDTVPTSVNMLTGFPHMLVSASSGEAAVFDVPFIYNRRALDLVETMFDQMGRFIVMVVNPLLDISGTVSTANVMVTAQFLDAELFMPHADIAASFETQSGKGVEGRIKSEKGSVSSIYNITKSIGSAVRAAALSSSYAGGAATVAQTAMSAAHMLGLSKPRTTDMTSVLKVNPYSDLNSGTGIDLTPTLGMDPENQISTKPNVGGIGIDEMDLKQICGTPNLTGIHTLGPTTSALGIETSNFHISPSLVTGSYAEWIANLFTFVSGSKKIKLYFMASQFHSARIVLYLSDAPTATQWQNCYHRIIDVQGDTQVEFTLPYTSSYVAASTGGLGSDFVLYVTVLSWSQPDASLNTPIYLNTYSAASDDIEFGGLIDEEFVVQSCPRNEFAKSFEPFHASMTGYKQEGFLFGEKYTTLRQVIHRYSAITQGSLLPTVFTVDHYMGTGDVANKKYIGLELIGLLFHFWRGSKRVKFIPKDQQQQSILIQNQDSRFLKGTAISCVPNPVAEIELPFYFNTLYLSTRSNTTQRASCGNVSHDTFLLTAAGDDFSFHFIRPPPLGAFSNPDNCGYALLKTFLLA